MPLFIFLSGSFSRPFSSKGFLKLVVTLVMPLLLGLVFAQRGWFLKIMKNNMETTGIIVVI